MPLFLAGQQLTQPNRRRAVIPAAAGGGSFDPLTISGLVAWYDADDASTFTFSSGVLVSQWNDKSGNGNHLTQGTAANQPSRNGTQNGHTTVVFDGSNDSLAKSGFTLSQPFTIVVVANDPGASQHSVVSDDAGNTRLLTISGKVQSFAGGLFDSGVSWGANVRDVTAIFNGASSKIGVDQGAYATGNTSSGGFATGLRVGAHSASDEFWTGPICELFIFSNGIADADRLNLEDLYISPKWGTP